MQHRYIGRSGLRVSPIALGTMTFGTQCDKKSSFEIMDKAYDFGINFFDTAEIYPVPVDGALCGRTEEFVGEWLKEKPRDSLILATKVAGAANGWFVPPIRHGLTAIDRFHITKALEGSLKRLKTDYIDLYQIHWPDTLVPIEEALEVLDGFVKEGKIRYIGVSNESAYGLTKANERAKFLKLSRFESVQNNFSLLNPRFFDELQSVCKNEQISLLPYSPLAGGVLSGKYNLDFVEPNSRYASYLTHPNERMRAQASRFVNPKTLEATKCYIKLAKEANISVTQMAIAWSISHKEVASSIIGATKVSQLDETLSAINIKLPNEVLEAIRQIQKNILYPMG